MARCSVSNHCSPGVLFWYLGCKACSAPPGELWQPFFCCRYGGAWQCHDGIRSHYMALFRALKIKSRTVLNFCPIFGWLNGRVRYILWRIITNRPTDKGTCRLVWPRHGWWLSWARDGASPERRGTGGQRCPWWWWLGSVLLSMMIMMVCRLNPNGHLIIIFWYFVRQSPAPRMMWWGSNHHHYDSYSWWSRWWRSPWTSCTWRWHPKHREGCLRSKSQQTPLRSTSCNWRGIQMTKNSNDKEFKWRRIQAKK